MASFPHLAGSMGQPFIANPSEHVWKLTSSLLGLQQSGKFCDLQLMCSDGIVMGEYCIVGPV